MCFARLSYSLALVGSQINMFFCAPAAHPQQREAGQCDAVHLREGSQLQGGLVKIDMYPQPCGVVGSR